MYPLLYLPHHTPTQEYLDEIPVTYDLVSQGSQEEARSTISLSQIVRHGEPCYQVVSVTVTVGPNEVTGEDEVKTTSTEVGTVTAGLVTLSSCRRTTARGSVSTRGSASCSTCATLTHTGEEYKYTVEEDKQDEEQNEKEEESDKEDSKGEEGSTSEESEDVVCVEDSGGSCGIKYYSLDSMADFISAPAAIVLEKLFAQRKIEAKLSNLKTFTETGETARLSYKVLIQDSGVEITKIIHQDGEDSTSIINMDSFGNILTIHRDKVLWSRKEGTLSQSVLEFESLSCSALYHSGRLSRLLRQEGYRARQAHLTRALRFITIIREAAV